MRKLFTIGAVLFCTIAVMAGPHHGGGRGGHCGPHHGGGRGGHCGPHYRHCGPGYYYGNRGLATAYEVTGIVANSLAIANNFVNGMVGGPVYTTPAPVYQQPVVVAPPTPVYTQPVYTPAPVCVEPGRYQQPIIETHQIVVDPYYPRTAPAVRYAPTVIYR